MTERTHCNKLSRYDIATSRKTEAITAQGLSSAEMLLKSIGVPLERDDLVWTTVSNSIMDKKFLDEKVKFILRLDNIASKMLIQGNVEGASRVMEDIGAELWVLPPNERDLVLQRLRTNMKIHESVTRNMLRQGHTEIATRLMELTE
jgi:hypothetical protein